MIADLAAWRAALTPERPAVWAAGYWYTYADLDRRAARLAARLHVAGVGRGDRVAILALNHLAHLDLILAAPRLGCVYTPFNYRLAAGELQALAQQVAPALLLVDADHAAAAGAFACDTVPLQDYEGWLDQAGAPAPPAPALTPDDPQMILFTGGSTGLPKGALIPYRQVWANAAATVLAWGVGQDDCAIQATPAFHAAVNVLTTPLLHAGGRVVWMPQFDAGAYLQLAREHGASVWFMVPTMYQMLAEHPDFARGDWAQVRWAVSGGAPCPPPVRETFAACGIRFRQGYGMTEVGVNCFAISLDEAQRKPDAVGRPMPGLRAALRHEDGSACAPDEVGELLLSGPQVFGGYFNRPEDTAASLCDGWFATGDLASVDADGAYFIRGRRKEMFISGGENVYPAEVEAALYALDGIAEVAVVGVPHPRWGETGLAAVVLRAGSRWDPERLRQALRQQLAGYKVPTEYLFMDQLPKSGAGKILKPELQRLYRERGEQQGETA